MPEYVVISHHHDPDRHVFRVVIGQRTITNQTMIDDDGHPLYAEYEDLELVVGYDIEGNEITSTSRVPVGEPMTEQVETVMPTEDFIFADGDERWVDKTDEQIADSQIRSIKRQLRRREETEREAFERAASSQRELPGVGRTL